jgi:hypothetical protein
VHRPALVATGLPVVAGLVGVVIGAVLAGVAVQAAFMDGAFLRKVARIGRTPVYYLAPFLFTATLGVLASLSVTVLAFTSLTAEAWFRGAAAGTVGFTAVYTLASLLHGLDTLVQFIDLKGVPRRSRTRRPTFGAFPAGTPAEPDSRPHTSCIDLALAGIGGPRLPLPARPIQLTSLYGPVGGRSSAAAPPHPVRGLARLGFPNTAARPGGGPARRPTGGRPC